MNAPSAPASTHLDRVLAGLSRAYPGPGGACAVLRRGEVLVRHAWGWANAERRIAFTPRTLFRMCSITKQFTCGVVLDAFPDPSVLDADVRARMPLLEQPAPGARHLCHNQSGLRDYWALAMLHGSPAEAPFGDAEAARIVAGTRTLHFAPGAGYSYVNQNFRMLADIAQGPHRPRLRRTAAVAHLRARRDGERGPGRRHKGDARRGRGLRGHPGHRLPGGREPGAVDRRCRPRRQPRGHDRVGAAHRRDAGTIRSRSMPASRPR